MQFSEMMQHSKDRFEIILSQSEVPYRGYANGVKNSLYILLDKETGVQYLYMIPHAITPLLDSSGKPIVCVPRK